MIEHWAYEVVKKVSIFLPIIFTLPTYLLYSYNLPILVFYKLWFLTFQVFVFVLTYIQNIMLYFEN